jgi:hypothetical protein
MDSIDSVGRTCERVKCETERESATVWLGAREERLMKGREELVEERKWERWGRGEVG